MFAYKKKVVPLQRQTKNDSVHVTLGYGVMVTQQILVLLFLVRIQVAQQNRSSSRAVFFFPGAVANPDRPGVTDARDAPSHTTLLPIDR